MCPWLSKGHRSPPHTHRGDQAGALMCPWLSKGHRSPPHTCIEREIKRQGGGGGRELKVWHFTRKSSRLWQKKEE